MNSEDADTRQKCITGVACKTGFSMPLMRWLPLVETQLSWYQPEHTSIELHQHGNRLQEWATPGLHGDVNQIERRIRVSDVLGLAAVTLRYQTGGNLAVLPNPGALGNLPWLTSFNSGEDLPHPHGAEAGDRTELRRYHSGDSTRFIHWKAFARSRKLMQRAPERSLSKTERTAAYLIAGQGDSASAAAALAALLSAGSETEFVFGADGTAEPVKTRSEIEAAIRDSAVQRKNGGKNLSAFIDTILSRGIANIMLFVPSLGGEWESKVYPLLADSELTYKVVIGIDGLEESPKSPLWYRLIMRTDATSDQKTGQLKKLVIRLEAAGAQVLVADRRSGRLFNARHLETGISSTKTYEQGAVQTA
ncbi:MAG: DUF58 domain-containing protein [Granulosicoccus sp.]|nr:DUF58 domain-containing protein [Granulosicoccus sp.]